MEAPRISLLFSRSRWVVGNREQIDIWKDRWLPTLDSFKVVSLKIPLESSKVAWLLDKEKRSWDVKKVAVEAVVSAVAEEISNEDGVALGGDVEADFLESDSATDTITSFQPISDPGYIISNGSSFRLGFFSPVDSTSRYLGIWYNNISVTTVVWVANRDKPLQDSSGVLTISADGLLVLLNGQKEAIWSAEVTTSVPNSSAQLLDTGNLVLIKNTTKTIIWQSFQLPCDTLLPKMNISTNLTTGNKVQLTSWKSLSDPSNGSFLVGIQPLDLRQVFIWKDGSSYWRSGPWNGQVFIGIPTTNNSGLSLVNDQEGTVSLSFSDVNNSLLHFQLNTQGSMEQRSWDHVKGDWEVVWATLQSECDVYGKCGAFGICNSQSSPICSCLNGFEPNNTEEWNRGNWTGGCVRSTPLQCERVATGGEAGKMDWFQTMNMMKVPDFADFSSDIEADCKQRCLQNCSCTAYAFVSGTGCMSWTGSLIDAQKFSSSGVDLNVRVANTKLGTKQDVKKIVTITVIVGTVSSSICTYCGGGWLNFKQGRRKERGWIWSCIQGKTDLHGNCGMQTTL
nr:g-type lectin s-receptor-like serine/threonine-protein kinase sd1-13 [Quercus suber]